jgi:hypothetical protein
MKLKPILIYLCLAVYAYFCYKMLAIAMQYIPYHTDVAFLGIKQDVIGLLHYRVAFFTHVYTSLWVLPAGFVQFNSGILKRYKRLHRISGWIYVVFVLLLVAPSGLVMGCYANGGNILANIILSFILILVLYYLTSSPFHTKKKLSRPPKMDDSKFRTYFICHHFTGLEIYYCIFVSPSSHGYLSNGGMVELGRKFVNRRNHYY